MRVGINTGPVVVGDIIGEGAALQAGVVGETPNVAARLQTLAQPNQVVIGCLTHELIGEAFACEDLGANRLKGIEAPVRAWRVVRARDIESRPHARRSGESLALVGRQEELGLLLRSWESSKRKQGQVVLIQGEAGIGKSRLVDALRRRLGADDYVWVATRCSPYHSNSTLYPVIQHLEVVRRHVERALTQLDGQGLLGGRRHRARSERFGASGSFGRQGPVAPIPRLVQNDVGRGLCPRRRDRQGG